MMPAGSCIIVAAEPAAGAAPPRSGPPSDGGLARHADSAAIFRALRRKGAVARRALLGQCEIHLRDRQVRPRLVVVVRP